jgi:hypothetical protein
MGVTAMSYDTEKNRIKVSKYRARRGLREAGYSEDEIDAIIQDVDWSITTPIEVLASLFEDDESSESNEVPSSPASTPAPPRAKVQQKQAPVSGNNEPASIGVLAIVGAMVVGVLTLPLWLPRLLK